MKVGYVRCSTAEQNEARQLKMMEEQGVEKIFLDKASGKNIDRTDFKAMMNFVRSGDTVIVESISRIARNTRDLLTIISTLNEKDVEFVSLKENLDTSTPYGRFMLTVFGAFRALKQGQNFHALDNELKTNTYTDASRTQTAYAKKAPLFSSVLKRSILRYRDS